MSNGVRIASPKTAQRPLVRAWILLGAYSVLYAGASYLTNEFILTEALLEEEWRESFDDDRVFAMMDQRRQWTIIGYGLIPAALLIKVMFTSLCLATGCAVADWTFRFQDVFQVAVHAEIVFAVAAIVHLGWSLFGKDFASMAEYASFYPLSALHLVTIDSSQLWLAYPLKTLNAFEAAYIGALSWELKDTVGKSARLALALVVCCYGTGLLLVMAAVTFLALYFL